MTRQELAYGLGQCSIEDKEIPVDGVSEDEVFSPMGTREAFPSTTGVLWVLGLFG